MGSGAEVGVVEASGISIATAVFVTSALISSTVIDARQTGHWIQEKKVSV